MISNKIKALLKLTGKRQSDLAEHLGIAAQSVANKMNRDSWSAKDLINVAEFFGGRLSITLSNGQEIYIDCDDDRASEEVHHDS